MAIVEAMEKLADVKSGAPSSPEFRGRTMPPWSSAGWISLIFIGICIAVPVVRPLTWVWRVDDSLSHGPLLIAIVAGLLWTRRKEMRKWNSAYLPGLFLFGFMSLLHVAAAWGDIDFLKPLTYIGMGAGVVLFLGGLETFKTAIGPIALLVFVIPWPSALVDRIAFPFQLLSSSYAAMLSGMVGVPIHREGVQLAVIQGPGLNSYQVLIAQQCSGLTSMTVLLALGYLIAYFTPVNMFWRAAMVAIVVPLAVFTNSVRLTVILFCGAHGSREMADWVHNNEGPVLIFLCSLVLTGLRSVLLAWLSSQKRKKESTEVNNEALPLINS